MTASAPTPPVALKACPEPWQSDWQKLDAAAKNDTGDEGEDGFNIGRRDGFSEAVQAIDMLTGGDGEYRYCTVADDSHCPDPDAMIARIVARIDAQRTPDAAAMLPAYDGTVADVFDAYLKELVGFDRVQGFGHLPATWRWHEFWERLSAALSLASTEAPAMREELERLASIHGEVTVSWMGEQLGYRVGNAPWVQLHPLASTEAGIGAGTPTPGSGKHDAPVPMLDPVHLAGGGAHVADAPGTFSAGIGAGEGFVTAKPYVDDVPAGMKRWDGGDNAPDDWDGGQTLFRDGSTDWTSVGHSEPNSPCWQHDGSGDDIIAYTPEPPAALDEHRARKVLLTVIESSTRRVRFTKPTRLTSAHLVDFNAGAPVLGAVDEPVALATSPRASGDRLREAGAIGEALGLFSSVIKSGEPWTDTCERVLISAREEQERFLRQLDQHSTALVNLTEHVGEYRKALRWYADHVGKCRMIHEEGEAARNALDRDCGARAEKVLAALRSVDAEAGK